MEKFIPSFSPEKEGEEKLSRELHHNEILEKFGIEVLPIERLATMGYGEVITYQTEMSDKICKAMASLTPEEDSQYRIIFDEALSKTHIISNIADLVRLRKQFNLPENL